jgi:hypothetical protein
MSFLIALIYLLLVFGVGAFFLRIVFRSKIVHPGYAIMCAGVLGVSVVSFLFLGLAHTNLLTLTGVTSALVTLAVPSALGWRSFLMTASAVSIPKTCATWWQSLDRWDRLALGICGIALLLYLSSAWAPARGADAMRYHLAQLKDLARNGSFVYRPYYHYNFPLLFTHFSFPVYFVAGGVGVKLLNFFIFCALLPAVYALGRIAGLTRPLFVVVLLVLTPSMLDAATKYLNDVTVALSCLCSVLLLHRFQREPRHSYLVLAYVAFGFALGVKYQSVLFGGWILWLTWVAIGRKLTWTTVAHVAALGLLVALMFAPLLIRNGINTGVPTWPMYQNLFGVEKDYLYEVSSAYSAGMSGKHDLATTIQGVKGVVTSVQGLPGLWLLLPLGLWTASRRGRAREDGLYLAFGVVSIGLIWWVAQPAFYPRFVNFFIPALLVLAAMGVESLTRHWSRRSAAAIIAVCALYGAAITVAYSMDGIQYQIDGNEETYHRFTWFWDEYHWINENLPADAELLVIVLSGHTYYLDRDYIRADPFLSGLIDWRSIDVTTLREELRSRGIRYVLYDNRDWGAFVGGDDMERVIEELAGQADVKTIWRRDIQLGTSRIRRHFAEAEVWLLEIGV